MVSEAGSIGSRVKVLIPATTRRLLVPFWQICADQPGKIRILVRCTRALINKAPLLELRKSKATGGDHVILVKHLVHFTIN